MSTILKALKKLENEQESRRPGAAGAIPEFNTRKAVQHAVRPVMFRRLGVKMGVAAGILVVLGSVVYIFLRQSSPVHPLASKPTQEMVKSQAPASQAQPASRGGRPSGIAKPRKPVFPKENQAESMESWQKPNPLASPASEGPSKVEPMPGKMNISTGQADTDATWNRPTASKRPSVSTERAEVPADFSQSRPPQQAAKDVSRFKEAEPLRDGRLKVQAIAWSPDAGERMAVINNRVIREGQTIGSFTIVAIGPDEVLAKEGPKTWKVAFGAP